MQIHFELLVQNFTKKMASKLFANFNINYKSKLWRNDMLNKLFKSVLHQDAAPIVICDMDHNIVYMNPSAVKSYHKDLTGQSVKACHNAESNEKIDRVVAWFKEAKDNNIIYTYHDEKENKDVYMVALRDDHDELIGYYEKHEYRNRETSVRYGLKK